MEKCPQCGLELFASGISPGKTLRCANCSAVFSVGEEEKTPADRWAWRSLYLGIASFIFLFIAGIPAIYYGIRSLLRMRIVPGKPRDKTAAVTGILLGGCVGVFFGFTILLVSIVVVALTWSREESREVAVVTQKCEQHFDFEVPDPCKPTRWNKLLNKEKFYFEYFSNEIEEMEILLQCDLSLVQANASFIAELRARTLNPYFRSNKAPVETMDWKFAGQSSPVFRRTLVPRTKRHESVQDDEVVQHYWATTTTDRKIYGMSVAFNPSKVNFDEEKVRQVFENVRIKEIQDQPEETKTSTNDESQ